VGKSKLKSTVGVASIGGVAVAETVAVGRDRYISNGVGVFSDGWKGVGVGEAFGATVTRMNGKACAACAGAGAEQPVRLANVTKTVNRLRLGRRRFFI